MKIMSMKYAKSLLALFISLTLVVGFTPIAHPAEAYANTSSSTKTVSKTQYKITYKLNGGKNNAKNPTHYTSKVTLKNPTKKGYTFKGWYTNSKFTSKSKVTSVSKGNKTLYAKWSKKSYKITYKLNGGKNSAKNPSKYTVTTSKISLKSPTKKGYTFKGWYSNKSLTKKVTSIAKGSTGNKTLYAKWAKKKSSAKKSSATSKASSGSNIVYLSQTGTKYHRPSCPTLKKTPRKTTKAKAKQQGYTACKVCKP